MRAFIIDLQTEDMNKNPNVIIEEKYKDGKKQKPGLIGELLPPRFAKEINFQDDLDTTFDLFKFCK